MSAENRVELAALGRHLRRAHGFSLAFVVVNHPSLRDDVLVDLVARTGGVVVRLRPGAGGPVTQIESAVGETAAPAVYLTDLEGLVGDGPSPALDNLNLNRDFLARRLRCPLVVLGPAGLVAAVSRRAPDLWSVRSTVFELVGDARAGMATVEAAGASFRWEVPPEERAAKARLLDDVAEEATETAEGDPAYLAALAVARGDAARMLDRYEEAEARYHEALPLHRQIGDRLGEANTLQALGDAARMLDRYEEAEARYHEALPLYRQIGDRLGEANTLKALGDAALSLDRYEEAEARYHEALPLYRQIGDRLGEANTLQALGDAARSLDRYEEAEARYHEALPLHRQIGSRLGEANTLLSLGRLRRVQGRWGEAVANLAEAERMYRVIGVDRWASRAASERRELEGAVAQGQAGDASA